VLVVPMLVPLLLPMPLLVLVLVSDTIPDGGRDSNEACGGNGVRHRFGLWCQTPVWPVVSDTGVACGVRHRC
jgi:hypothetical protein